MQKNKEWKRKDVSFRNLFKSGDSTVISLPPDYLKKLEEECGEILSMVVEVDFPNLIIKPFYREKLKMERMDVSKEKVKRITGRLTMAATGKKVDLNSQDK